jgi:diacylglycerol kinase family enzyme
MLQIAVVRTRNVAALLPALVAGISGANKLPGVDVYAAAHVSVSATPQLPIQYDGETVDAATPFSVRVLPNSANLLLPSDSPYAR